MVVLPAPLVPRSPKISPRRDLEVDALHGLVAAVGLAEAGDGDDGFARRRGRGAGGAVAAKPSERTRSGARGRRPCTCPGEHLFDTVRSPDGVARGQGQQAMDASGYAELHCHTNFSFLDGASHPEELVDEAARLGLAALAVTDHDGFYGIVRFAGAAARRRAADGVRRGADAGLARSMTGVAEVTCGRSGDPPAAGRRRSTRPASTSSCSPRGRSATRALPARSAPGSSRGRRARPASTSRASPPTRAAAVHLTGAARVAHQRLVVRADRLPQGRGARRAPAPTARPPRVASSTAWSTRSAATACSSSCGTTATRSTVTATTRSPRWRRAPVSTSSRPTTCTTPPRASARSRPRSRRCGPAARSTRSTAGSPPPALAHLRSAAEQQRRFARWPGAVERTVDVARECAFDLRLAAPDLPDSTSRPATPTCRGCASSRGAARRLRYPATHPQHEQALRQIDYELGVIEQLNFPGYFLLLVDIVEFCRRNDIYCQGRGSAANSAVCYALGVTKADAVALGLLFERFLSPERDGPPDIDLDIEHQRREEVIQYVYEKYGRDRAAQVANVITYRPKSALREMAKAVGVSPGQADALTKWVDRWSGSDQGAFEGAAGDDATLQPSRDARARRSPTPGARLPAPPRHPLGRDGDGRPPAGGVLPGGVGPHGEPLGPPVGQGRLRGRRPGEVRPARSRDAHDAAPRRRPRRASTKASRSTSRRSRRSPRSTSCCARPTPSACSRSRAAPRWRRCPGCGPRCFYDLVVEVALIRPGPIQGGSVHPYLRRRNGEEPVTYPHPLLEPCLKKTLGVPLFQEQLMQIAIDAAGFRPGEADRLRQAMGSKRSTGAHGRDARAAHGGHGRARHHRRDRRRDRDQARGVRALRLPREPLGELRLPRVLELVDQAALPGGVRVRAAQRAADGLLLAAHDRARRGAPRRADARPRRQSVSQRDCTLEPRTAEVGAARVPACRAGTRTRRRTRCASGCATCAASPTRSSTASTTSATRAARSPTSRTSPGGPARPSTRWRRSRPRARSGRSGSERRDALWAAGALRDARPERRRGVDLGDAARCGHRGRGARAARHDRGGGDRRRPVGHRPVGRAAPDRVRARRAGGQGRRDRRGAAHAARPVGGRGGRRRHPPPAA